MYAKIISKKTLAENTYLIRGQTDGGFNFSAGQFIMVNFSRHGAGEIVKRAYSIASCPDLLPNIELLIKCRSNSASRPFIDKLSAGDTLNFNGPFGNFILKNTKKRHLFIAAGTGIAPIKSMIDTWKRSIPRSPAALLYGAHNNEQLIFNKDFGTLCQECSDIKYLGVSATDDGHITEYIDKLIPNPVSDEVYICGPPAMCAACENVLETYGFAKENINKEGF